MEFKDYYDILGIPADADKQAIKTAYRKMARKYHPDVSSHSSAEEKFKDANEAYEVLKDTEKRAEYDALRQYAARGHDFTPPPGWQPESPFGDSHHSAFDGDFSEFFSSVFGGRFDGGFNDNNRSSHFDQAQQFQRRGRDVETDLPIFLEDTLSEASKPLSYHLNGENKTLQIKIPVGVSEGKRIRLKGQGEAGAGNMPNGDLYVRIKLIPHPLCDVEYHDLIITVPLAPWEAALGTKITLPTLSTKIQLTVPANSQSGQRLRIRGQGLMTKTGRGNLYAVLKIVIPETSSESSRQHWQALADKTDFDPRSEWSNYL
jgi:curved DNA-binding protein